MVRLAGSPWAAGVEVRHLEILHDTLERDLYRNIQLTTVALGVSYSFGAL
jgi:hypothetical protein